MFIGHFAVGLAGRRLTPGISLAIWFLAAQLLDVIWPVLILTGIEHVRIEPGNTAFTPLNFYDYPISHSLVGTAVWASLMWLVWRLWRGAAGAALLFAGVVSHWILDFISHRPDMPVLPHGPYVGLGLWNSVPLTLAVESAMFVAGVLIYARAARPRVRFWVFVAVLYVLYLASAFGPPPPSVPAIGWVSLAGIAIILPWAWWADRDSDGRGPRIEDRDMLALPREDH
jgi:membrane-bound metal-dependent hydrolase YbcI (DUF457 family)